MNKPVFLWLLMLFLSFKSNGQEMIAELNTILDLNGNYLMFSFPVIDEKSENLFLFTHHGLGFNGYLYEKGSGLTSEIRSEHPRNKYIHFRGSTVRDSTVCLYLATDFHRKMLVREFDFAKGTFSDTELKPFPSDESYITSVGIGSCKYILTVKKNSSLLGIYSFEGSKEAGNNRIDLSDVKFNGRTLYDALNSPSADAFFIPSIENFAINTFSPEYTNAINKLYEYNGMIYLTINNDVSCTHLIKIDPRELTAVHTSIKIPDGGFKGGNSNSFFHNGILYQVHICKEGLILSGLDIDKSVLIKEHVYRAGDGEISFANTPVLARKPSGYTSITANEFLEKASSGTPGLLVKSDRNFNKVFTGITRGNAVYSFGSLLDASSMEHIEGQLQPDATYRIRDFFASGKIKPIAQTLFKYRDKTIFGYYNKKQKKYYLFEF